MIGQQGFLSGSLLVETLLNEAGQLMLTESKLAAKFGISYQESPTLATIRGLQTYLQNRGEITVFNILSK